MALALVTLTFAQLLDLGTFLSMVSVHGPAAEANPIVVRLILPLGLEFAAVAKIAVLSLVVAVVVVLGQDANANHRRIASTIVGIAVVAGLIGGWTNAEVLRATV